MKFKDFIEHGPISSPWDFLPSTRESPAGDNDDDLTPDELAALKQEKLTAFRQTANSTRKKPRSRTVAQPPIPPKPQRSFITVRQPLTDDDLYAFPVKAAAPEGQTSPLSSYLSKRRNRLSAFPQLPSQKRGVQPEPRTEPSEWEYYSNCSTCNSPTPDNELDTYNGQCERCALQNTSGSHMSGSFVPKRRENKAKRPFGQLSAMRKIDQEDNPWAALGYR